MSIQDKEKITHAIHSPHAFVTKWNRLIKEFDRATIDAEGSLIGVWLLADRKIKYKKVIFDNCSISIRMRDNHPEYIECQVGLIHNTKKEKGPCTTHWRTVMLSRTDFNYKAIIFSKIVIAATNLTRQGKLESDVCVSIMELIERTLEE